MKCFLFSCLIIYYLTCNLLDKSKTHIWGVQIHQISFVGLDNTVRTLKIQFQNLASAIVKKSNACTAHQLILELSPIWLKLSLIWLMERDKMAISQGNNHHPQTEAPLCQRTNGWSALYGTSPHTIWSIVSCGHFVSCPATQKAKEWKKHLSMCRSSCHRWPEGKYFELVNWLPESDGRYYSHWQERVSRGRRGGRGGFKMS